MSSYNWPPTGIPTYATFADFPSSAGDGTLALALDTDVLYAFNTTLASWISIGGGTTVLLVGTIDSVTPSSNGAVITANSLIMQSASLSLPGLVNNTTQSFSGAKTFSEAPAISSFTLGSIPYASTEGLLEQDNNNLFWDETNKRLGIGQQGSTPSASLDVHISTGNNAIQANNIGAQSGSGGATIAVISDPGVAISSGSRLGQFTFGGVFDASHTLVNSSALQGFATENWSSTAIGSKIVFFNTANTTTDLQTVLTLDQDKSATFTGTLLASNLSGTNTGDVTLGTANGLSLVSQVLSLGGSSTSTTGALSSTDWNTFNNKQDSGTYITALTSDVSASGPGSVVATVNSVGGSSSTNIHTAELAANASTESPTSGTILKRDSNSNTRVNNLIDNFNTIATSAGTSTLTVASAYCQQFTGSSTQQVNLPDTSTLVTGQAFQIMNRSSGIVTVKTTGGTNLVQSLVSGSQAIVTCTSTASNASSSWDSSYSVTSAGTVTSVTFSGDGTVLSSTPSSAVTSSGTVTAALNTQTANKILAGPTSGGASSPTFRAIVAADLPTATQHQVFLTNGNGHGSTNTKIRRYSTAQINVGTSLTYTDSATNGMSVTVNDAGVYAITVSDSISSATAFNIGVSVNGTALTTVIYTLTWAQGYRASMNNSVGGNFYATLTQVLYLAASDVVRAQDDGTPNATDVRTYFNIVRVA